MTQTRPPRGSRSVRASHWYQPTEKPPGNEGDLRFFFIGVSIYTKALTFEEIDAIMPFASKQGWSMGEEWKLPNRPVLVLPTSRWHGSTPKRYFDYVPAGGRHFLGSELADLLTHLEQHRDTLHRAGEGDGSVEIFIELFGGDYIDANLNIATMKRLVDLGISLTLEVFETWPSHWPERTEA